MALYVGDNILSADATYSLKINNGLVDCLYVQPASTYNHIRQPSSTFFIAGNTNASGWVDQTDNAWNKMVFNVVTQNTGSGFSTANSRFVAPLEGYYIFSANSYINRMDSTPGYYAHPMFWVNGAAGTRRPYSNTQYRMRGYGLNSTYTVDGAIEEIMYLYVGDYVEYYIYATPQIQVYYNYLYFAGWFVG